MKLTEISEPFLLPCRFEAKRSLVSAQVMLDRLKEGSQIGLSMFPD